MTPGQSDFYIQHKILEPNQNLGLVYRNVWRLLQVLVYMHFSVANLQILGGATFFVF